MTYLLESLGDERFQQLCQALLVAVFPDTQCLPVGQPDGGRDGVQRSAPGQGFAIYQVKFVKQPGAKDEREAVQQVIKLEKAKVERLIERGATSYYLLTNASGTSHLDSGSIDKVNAELTETFGIPSYCWWRDDIERRIDYLPHLKWSYPEILRATDLLPSLLNARFDAVFERRANAIRSYMAHQARQDSQLKFKQIDLQKDIFDLFVDVPATLLPAPEEDERAHAASWQQLIADSGIEPMDDAGERSVNSVGALELLINERFITKAQKLVVEGAPGQGKSTITQYLCQVNRLLLLNKQSEIKKVAIKHFPKAARIPFRIDLRDYASWLAGRDPFAEEGAVALPATATPILESFIAAQVARVTGMTFSVDDLSSLASVSQILIVLDGFDEVADIRLRNKIVSEVSEASTRIGCNAISSQIIVTSRPAAFANSPGFPRDEWKHLEILPLTPSVIDIYAHRWLDGRGTEPREKRGVLSVLEEKLTHPHVRDLARNPMQLAILLALISVQGASLPDKRTALYDEYIKIFLNREAEKSSVVRDHRDLLVQIHRYLAWVLQSEAESDGSGNISEGRLKEVLGKYLETNGNPIELVDRLFTGMVERVVALVSRVQGTFEFEVQPLREYFAARYLYDTAPQGPASVSPSGGKPERFEAISRNFYWLNVTRFYAGCYNSGELASLVEGMKDLEQHAGFSETGYPAQLGLILLNDYVFTNYPKVAAGLAARIAEGQSLRVLIAEGRFSRGSGLIQLPRGVGDKIETSIVEKMLLSGARDQISAAGEIVGANWSIEKREGYWLNLRSSLANDKKWILIGSAMQIFRDVTVEHAMGLVKDIGRELYFELADEDRFDVLEKLPGAWEALVARAVAGGLFPFPLLGVSHSLPIEGFIAGRLSSLLWPYMWVQLSSEQNEARTVGQAIVRLYFGDDVAALSEDLPSEFLSDAKYGAVCHALSLVWSASSSELRSDSGAWSSLIEECRRIWGNTWTLYVASCSYADAAGGQVIEQCKPPVGDASLCEWALFAKKNSHDIKWWKEQFDGIKTMEADWRNFVLLCAIRWMPLERVFQCGEMLSDLIDSLPSSDWPQLNVGMLQDDDGEQDADESAVDEQWLPALLSPRLASLLLRRISSLPKRRLFWARYLEHYEGEEDTVWYSVLSVAVDSAYSDATHWQAALGIISRAYSRGVGHHFAEHDFLREPSRKLPVDTARLVCKSPERYPLSLVGAASTILRKELGAAAEPVTQTAERDRWFAELT